MKTRQHQRESTTRLNKAFQSKKSGKNAWACNYVKQIILHSAMTCRYMIVCALCLSTHELKNKIYLVDQKILSYEGDDDEGKTVKR